MHKNTIIFVITFLTSLGLWAQSGSLKGTVSDAMTGETIPMANVIVKADGVTIIGGASDFDGNFTLKPINPGRYSVEVSFIGYATMIQTNVLISPSWQKIISIFIFFHKPFVWNMIMFSKSKFGINC